MWETFMDDLRMLHLGAPAKGRLGARRSPGGL